MQQSLKRHPKKRFGPGPVDEDVPEFQVAPMVDVLLVLLLFFMVAATSELASRKPNLILPEASDAVERSTVPGQAVIQVEPFSSWVSLGELRTENPEELVSLLRKAKENDVILRGGNGSSYRVLIRAHKSTEYSLIKKIMAACARAGIANVTFAVNKVAEGGATVP